VKTVNVTDAEFCTKWILRALQSSVTEIYYLSKWLLQYGSFQSGMILPPIEQVKVF